MVKNRIFVGHCDTKHNVFHPKLNNLRPKQNVICCLSFNYNKNFGFKLQKMLYSLFYFFYVIFVSPSIRSFVCLRVKFMNVCVWMLLVWIALIEKRPKRANETNQIKQIICNCVNVICVQFYVESNSMKIFYLTFHLYDVYDNISQQKDVDFHLRTF